MTGVPFILAALLALPAAAPAAGAADLVSDQLQRSQQPLRIPDAGRFRDWDRNNDGIITRSEWQGTAEEFRDLDWNRDGMLSGTEVRETVDPESAAYSNWSSSAFASLDRNRDGRVSRAEWRYDLDTFKRVDDNNDNVLTRAEFMGGDVATTDWEPERGERFNDLDWNNDNRVERYEWNGTYVEFNRLDRNHDGVLSRQEVNAGDVARTGYENDFYQLDRNNDGMLGRNEWRGSRATFERHDVNHDGLISRREYNQVEHGVVNTISRVVEVDSRQPWTDSGIWVQAGDQVTYRADGTIQMSTKAQDLATPAGSTTGRNATNSPRPDQKAGGLLIRIGNASVGFLGASGTFTAESTGELYLGINDDYFQDNTGSYRVTLSLRDR